MSGDSPRSIVWIASLLGVLALALIVRVVYFNQARATPDFGRAVVDAEAYDRAARGFLDGSWPGDQPYYQDPLYPYVLALHYAAFGTEPAPVLAAQHAAGLLTVAAIFALGGLLGGLSAALTAGLLAATYAPLLFYEGILLKTSLGVVLLSLALPCILLAQRRHVGWGLAAGAILGAATLVRANLLLLLPAAMAWIVLTHSARTWASRGTSAAALALGFGIAVAPCTLHNLSTGVFALTTTQAGQNFYIGNNPANETGTYVPPAGVRHHPFFERDDFLRLAEQDEGRELTPAEASSYWFGRSFEYWRDHPLDALALLGRKILLVLNHYEVPDNVHLGETSKQIALLRAPLPTFWWALVLGVLGFCAAPRRSSSLRFLAVALVLIGGSTAAFFVFSRYRMMLVPPLLALAGLAPAAVAAHWRAGHRRTLAGLVAVVLATGGLTALPLTPDEGNTVLYNHAINAFQDGDRARARELMQAAHDADPDEPRARTRLAMLVREDGEPGAALTLLQPVIDTRPQDALAHREYGLTLLALNQPRNAKQALEVALRLDADDAAAVIGIAQIELGTGLAQAALQRLESFLASHPDAQRARHELGTQYAQAARFADAEECFRQVAAAEPNNLLVKTHLGLALEMQQRSSEAAALYREVLSKDPEQALARQRLEGLE